MSVVLVTGGTGQVASALGRLGQGGDVSVVGRPAFDFDRPETIDAVFGDVAPDVVVNAAAYTAVDRAESEQDSAWRANHAGPERLARLCAQRGTRLIHLSTDYVFDGQKVGPYVEGDPTGPTGVYGASKLAGERAVLAALPEAIVLRTAWVFAGSGQNFLVTMLNAAKKTPRLRVVADQFGSPTFAHDLAAAIFAIVAHPRWQPGLYHASGAGSTNWHGFAEAIFDRAAVHGVGRPEIAAITTAEWPTPAQRPRNSRLDCSRLARRFGIALPDWRDGVDRAVDAALGAAGKIRLTH